MTIRPTTYADIEALQAIFDYARAQMAAIPTKVDGFPKNIDSFPKMIDSMSALALLISSHCGVL